MKTRIALLVLLVVALAASAAASVSALVPAVPTALVAWRSLGWVLVGALVLHVVGHLVRSEKHTALLREIRPIGRAQVFRGQMIGFMFSALLPARAGELVRAHYVGRSVQISRAAVLATIAFERVIDLVVVGLVGLVGAALLVDGVPFWAPPLVALAAAGVLAALLWVCFSQPTWFLSAVYRTTGILNDRLSARGRQIVWSFCHALIYALPSRRVLTRYVLLSILMWAAYLGSTTLLAVVVLGGADRLGAAVVGGAAPFLGLTGWTGPAVFGNFADRFASVLAGQPNVAALTILTWTLLVVPSVLIGAVCLLHRRLVEHKHGVPDAPLLRNKLFRDVYASDEFSHLLATHFQGETLARIVSREESLGRFTVIRPLKGGSHASTLLVWQDDEVRVKKLTLPEFASKLRSQHDWLAARADRPEIVGVVGVLEAADHFALDIEFRDGYVSFFEHLHATTKEQAWEVLDRMLDFMGEHVYHGIPVADPGALVRSYIADKVVGKIRDCAAMSKDVSRLSGYSTLEVNGEPVRGLAAVLDEITASTSAMADLADFLDGPIHGDLTIDNLMIDPATGEFMIIDPNDENAISDPIVDHAKLLQSLHSGYEFLVMQDRVDVHQASVRFEERRSAHYEHLYEQCRRRFERDLTPGRYRCLLFHEAVHYCRMLTYRAAIDPGSVAMYYAVAVRLFNRFLEQYSVAAVEGAVAHGGALTHRA